MNYIEGVKYIVVVWGPSPVGCRQFIEAFLAGLGGGQTYSGVDANVWSGRERLMRTEGT